MDCRNNPDSGIRFRRGLTLFQRRFVSTDMVDHTLKLLLKHDANGLAENVEMINHLPRGALGRTLHLPEPR